MRPIPLLLLLIVLLIGSPAGADDVIGTYEGEANGKPLIVRVEKTGPDYSGTIKLNNTVYPFTATLGGSELDGTFKAEGGTFPFTLSFLNDRIQFATGKSSYALTRAAGVNVVREPPPADDGKSLVFTKYTLVEPTEKIKVAHWLMPKGWKVDGGVVWRHNRALYATYDLRISNPGTLQQLRGIPVELRSTPTMPGQQGLDFEGMEYAPLIENPADYITKIAIPQHCRDLPTYKIVGYEPLPRLAEKAQQATKPVIQPGVPVTASAGRLRVEYELNGQPVEEDFYCALVFIDLRAQWQQMGLANGPIQYFAHDLYSIRAEKGRVDQITPMLHATISTMHEDIQMFALRAQIDQIRLKGARDRVEIRRKGHEQIRKTQLEINDIITKGYEDRIASQERLQRQFVDAIRGIDRYVDPTDTATQVQLPTGYEKAWSNGLGEYVLSNDAFFDPNRDSSQKWEPMKRAKD